MRFKRTTYVCCCAVLCVSLLNCDFWDQTVSNESIGEERDNNLKLPQEGSAKFNKIHIASWNLKLLHRQNYSGKNKRSADDYQRLRWYADRIKADIVALQEIDDEPAARRLFDASEYKFHMSRRQSHQKVGFTFRKELPVIPHQDLRAFNVGSLRHGVDIALQLSGFPLRILNIHLKAGCQRKPLNHPIPACKKLRKQISILEKWIDERTKERVPAIVIGDFNRDLSGQKNSFWQELDDGDPLGLKLFSANRNLTPKCWQGAYSRFIDHIVLNNYASPLWIAGSFSEHQYQLAHTPYKQVLSDHCAISIKLDISPSRIAKVQEMVKSTISENDMIDEIKTKSTLTRRIKGNINASGNKIYHLPHCPNYEETRVDPRKGERWFENEREAKTSGWRKARNCP